MHNNDGQRERSVRLPMAMTKYLDARLNFDQPLFGLWQTNASLNQKTCNRLHVPAAQPATWRERTRLLLCLRNTHTLILNRSEQFSSWSFSYADLRVHLQGMSAPVRGLGLRPTKGGVPEMSEQETRAAAFRIRSFGEERRRFPTDFLRGADGCLWFMRRPAWTGGLLPERPRLSPLFALKCLRSRWELQPTSAPPPFPRFNVTSGTLSL